MAPLITKGAVTPSRRSPATKVVVVQCPNGALPTSRAPRRQRPRARVMLVLAQVSSMKTRRAGSMLGCSSRQRSRAAATSGRSCSAARRLFFEGQLLAVAEAPDRAIARRDAALGQLPPQLLERDVRLLGHPRQKPLPVRVERRLAPAHRPRQHAPGHPKAPLPALHAALADAKPGATARLDAPATYAATA